MAPEPGGDITSANATYFSPYGVVRSTWNVTNAGFTLEVQILQNARAGVVLPNGKNELLGLEAASVSLLLHGYVLRE